MRARGSLAVLHLPRIICHAHLDHPSKTTCTATTDACNWHELPRPTASFDVCTHISVCVPLIAFGHIAWMSHEVDVLDALPKHWNKVCADASRHANGLDHP